MLNTAATHIDLDKVRSCWRVPLSEIARCTIDMSACLTSVRQGTDQQIATQAFRKTSATEEELGEADVSNHGIILIGERSWGGSGTAFELLDGEYSRDWLGDGNVLCGAG